MTSDTPDEPLQQVPPQAERSQWRGLLPVALVAILLLGAGVRLDSLDGTGIVHDRQYRSALVARAYYFESLPTIPEWRRLAAVTSRERQEPLEPQITERVIAALYGFVGSEDLRIARAVCAVFWMVGAFPLFFLARRLGGASGAVFATAFYVLSPLGVQLSISILPESLMITMMLFSLLAIVRYHDRIRAMHVKDAEFRPDGRVGVYGGYQDWVGRAGRFRSLGDGQVDFTRIFSLLTQYGYDGWAILEWECCIKSPEQGAREGAPFIRKHIIEATEVAFDDFAGGESDRDLNRRMLGLQ
jgi:hypothetical protein